MERVEAGPTCSPGVAGPFQRFAWSSDAIPGALPATVAILPLAPVAGLATLAAVALVPVAQQTFHSPPALVAPLSSFSEFSPAVPFGPLVTVAHLAVGQTVVLVRGFPSIYRQVRLDRS